MSWAVRQTRRFARACKKLHDNFAADVDAAVEAIAANPDIGRTVPAQVGRLSTGQAEGP